MIIGRMELDFEKAVGRDEAARESFCDIQKDQVAAAGPKHPPRILIQDCFQIAEYLDTDTRNLKNCSLREGSVIVSMNVEGYDELEAAELEKATDDLEQMIAEGKVGLMTARDILSSEFQGCSRM